MNTKRIEALPQAWKVALREAASASALRSLARAQHRNAVAMRQLIAEGVRLRQLPASVMTALQGATKLEPDKAAALDQGSASVIESWRATMSLLAPYAQQVDVAALLVRGRP